MNTYSNPELTQLTEMPEVLYHWTEEYSASEIKTTGFKEGGLFLTRDGDDPEEYWNEDIIWLYRPTRIEIDTSYLDLKFLYDDPYSGEDREDQSYLTTGNALYKLAIPAQAVLSIKTFMPARSWKVNNDQPEDHGYPEDWVDPMIVVN
jgi:hypothetical protein